VVDGRRDNRARVKLLGFVDTRQQDGGAEFDGPHRGF
jgi:hypothetical protein